MQYVVGGNFDVLGFLELETLKYFGLEKSFYIIDVGCGSGRLAKPLSEFLEGKYLGIDIIPELVDHARRLANRPDWRFEVARGLSIQAEDGVADMVCFFSVFTHLLHEQSYLYLQEAKRVLKPHGKILFSFLDFAIPEHWYALERNIKYMSSMSEPINVFIGKDAIEAWTRHLGLQVEAIKNGNEGYLPLGKRLAFENGSTMEKLGSIGQSVCVLCKHDAG